MALDFHAGKRVLYKNGGSSWLVGEIQEGNAEITPLGLFIPIIPKEYIGEKEPQEVHWAEVNQIFLDAVKLDESIKDYKNYYMSKEDYLQFIESDDFHRSIENAYFTDGEYIYYPVSKYSKSWIERQPFNYIVRND